MNKSIYIEVPESLSKRQSVYLWLLRNVTHNHLNGNRVADILMENRAVWHSFWFGCETQYNAFGALLRDLDFPEGYAGDCLMIAVKSSNMQLAEDMLSGFRATEIDWEDERHGLGDGMRILRVFWG